ncbi:tetraspanin-19-like isoform X2 [Amaranthus tricolor]|uniref:tetraspanin-19-like isoform X2 n=1 Tax=Amaranthus tricolor TaxID=29722 RepID=UPI0025867A9A|nr:tetraspanin-19-like isoform X2 [Amaranthus tricolor]
MNLKIYTPFCKILIWVINVIIFNPRDITMDGSVSKRYVAATLKISNSVMAMTGISILMYSVWIIVVCLREYQKYPFPWFLWACLGTGGLFIFISFIGHGGAATTLDFLLSSDFPRDPTGRFDALVHYIDSNKENFTKLGLLIASSQVISLILAMILRATRPFKSRLDLNEDDENTNSSTLPFLVPQNQYLGDLPYAVGHPDPYYYHAAPSYKNIHGYPDIEGTEKGENIAATVIAIPKGC